MLSLGVLCIIWDMNSIAQELKSTLAVAERLHSISEAAASVRPAPGKWSCKEILGHLTDSAANNHQRFVRLQLSGRLELPGYAQDDWVRVQRYQDEAWFDIVNLWQMYNTHLVTVIRHVAPSTLRNTWKAPGGEELDLEFIIRDYVRHMRHHLDQILSRVA